MLTTVETGSGKRGSKKSWTPGSEDFESLRSPTHYFPTLSLHKPHLIHCSEDAYCEFQEIFTSGIKAQNSLVIRGRLKTREWGVGGRRSHSLRLPRSYENGFQFNPHQLFCTISGYVLTVKTGMQSGDNKNAGEVFNLGLSMERRMPCQHIFFFHSTSTMKNIWSTITKFTLK